MLIFFRIIFYVFHILIYYIYETFIQWWNFLKSKILHIVHKCLERDSHFCSTIPAWTQFWMQDRFLFGGIEKQLGMLKLGHFSSLWIDEAECILLCSCCRGQPHMPQDQDLLSGSSSEAPSHSVWGLIKQYKATVLSECACFGKTIPDFPIIKIIFHSLYFWLFCLFTLIYSRKEEKSAIYWIPKISLVLLTSFSASRFVDFLFVNPYCMNI